MMQQSTGRLLWGVLHEFASNHSTLAQRRVFLSSWFQQVKQHLGCATCFKKLERFQKHWHFDQAEDFYIWTVCLHDYVNKELGKPLYRPKYTLVLLKRKGIVQ